ncbi:MAG: 3-phosphoserine/phosphohydroxythreonine transaminase [Bacteroidota bacterium]|nr:3-phosphoserine/phosphohydroxythreonine transaminase [Bacteroidota bacterium]
MKKIHNFSAGPAILPQEALQEAAEGLKNFKGTGMSVVEISHRSPEWEESMAEAESLVRELMGVNDDFAVVFLQGGASSQFTMIPYNFLPQNGMAAYLKTGTWASNAIKEARLFGEVNVVASSEDKNFNYIPTDYTVPGNSAYFHITTNNTIFGTQLQEIPESPVPIIADMSSDIFSRPVQMEKYGLIYAGAQKNMGPAGTTLVIVRKDLLGKVDRKIPTMLNYSTHIEKESMFNTPPVFAIYLSMLTLKWLKRIGGVNAIQKINQEKAELLYNEIDSNPLFEGTTAIADRSLMNVTFLMKDKSFEKDFLAVAENEGCVGLPGHRSVGGFRASLYNALPKESVEHLVNVMKEFAHKHAPNEAYIG